MSRAKLTSKGRITLPKSSAESPCLDEAYGMLQHLAKRKRASIDDMHTAVRKRARRKYASSRRS